MRFRDNLNHAGPLLPGLSLLTLECQLPRGPRGVLSLLALLHVSLSVELSQLDHPFTYLTSSAVRWDGQQYLYC